MKNLPDDWYERSMAPILEESKTWPDWMWKGVEEVRARSEREIAAARAEDNPQRREGDTH
jgi:hypothetical protein